MMLSRGSVSRRVLPEVVSSILALPQLSVKSNGSQLSARKGASPLVVGGQVPLIPILFIGTPNIAGVVKSEPRGLLYKMRTGEMKGQDSRA